MCCVYACVCVCERASERESRGGGGVRGREEGRRREKMGEGGVEPGRQTSETTSPYRRNRSVVIGQMSAHTKPHGAACSLAVVFT